MKPQNPLILVMLLIINSCVFLTENNLNQTINENSFLNRFPSNHKSIVILKFKGKSSPISGDWLYLCSKKEIPKSCKKIYAGNKYQILMLTPGVYHAFPNHKNSPILNREDIFSKKNSATLNIISGKIIYAGDFSLKYRKKTEKVIFRIKNNSSKVENLLLGKNKRQAQKLFDRQKWEINYLVKNYDHLQDRFTTQLFQFNQIHHNAN